ncbi:hypothetical protein GCM10010145_33220 [Streptomyces ruber]|uniref:NodB homology domain-containing protein n=2 Tax=Streptomyces TaxID=1883 RepID=A0A918ER76_9ACTN|nr:polysaccharide deacetylase family protein [Streptomyces ruber]GGQ60472.1 hypothetical protein GCM10010145_33220 [Streptomyces ruber]
MTDDQTTVARRRVVMASAAVLAAAGAAGTAALLTGERPPGRPPAPGPVAVAGGSPVRRTPRSSAYRLHPLTGYGPQRRVPARPRARRRPLEALPGLGHAMVLTFDDGPDARYTPAILRTLREHDVRAMFFVCGEMAEAYPDLLREMADDGHVVGNHTWSHPLLTRLSRAGIRREMESTCEIVERLCGAPPQWFRAPYGAWNRAAFRLGAELGMEPLAWTVDTLDWQEPGVRTILDLVEDGAGPGVVVLSHDAGGDRSQTVRALRGYLPRLLESGHRITVPRRRYD